MTRNLLRWFARVMIGTLLFSQLAVAAHACSKMLPSGNAMGMAAGPEQSMLVIAEQANTKADVEASDCAGMAKKTAADSDNVCAAHCLYGQQSDQVSTITVPVALLSALYVTPSVPELALPPRSAAGTLNALVAASPPHTVLHCVYRI